MPQAEGVYGRQSEQRGGNSLKAVVLEVEGGHVQQVCAAGRDGPGDQQGRPPEFEFCQPEKLPEVVEVWQDVKVLKEHGTIETCRPLRKSSEECRVWCVAGITGRRLV